MIWGWFKCMAFIVHFDSNLVPPPPHPLLSSQTVKKLLVMQEIWNDLWVGKILWRRKRQPTPVFLPEQLHGQRSLESYSLCVRKKLDTTEPLTLFILFLISSVQLSSVTQSCPTLCHPMNRSTPGLPTHHQLPESTQTHVHWVGDAIQSSRPLSSPPPPTLNLFQHQGLFRWVSSKHQVATVLEFQLQHQSFQWTPRTDFL